MTSAGPPVEGLRPRRSTIEACPDGPLLVRGDVTITDSDGVPVPRRRETVALCRCGASTIKPYCDGTHKAIGFVAP
jgi:CDGSH-type Zn-finger protein